MIESVQARQFGNKDFRTIYTHLCALQDTCPLASVRTHLKDGSIDLNVDRIRFPDWTPILNALRINKSLQRISLKSYYQKPVKADAGKLVTGHQHHKPPPILSKDVTFKICTALRECLQTTESLESLQLQGIPLRCYDVETIAKGLSKTRTLQHLSIEYCHISHASVELLCQAIHSTHCIKSINLTGCGITKKGADAIAKLIKHQSTSRHSEAWKDSLRYRRPNLDQMPGLRRITLNNNPLINDSGAIFVADALKDDLWLKALDMQHCGISDSGAAAMLETLRANSSIVVLDIRRNPLVDHNLLKDVIEQVLINGEGKEEYPWLMATTMDPQKTPAGMVIKKRRRKKKESKSSPGPLRAMSSIRVHKENKPVIRPGPGFIPWRSAARAEERQRSTSSVPMTMLQPSKMQQAAGGVQSGWTGIMIHRTPPAAHRRTSPKANKASSVVVEEFSESDDDGTTTKDESTSTTSQLMRRQQERANKDVLVRLEELQRRLELESKARAAANTQIVELTIENSDLKCQLQLATSNQILSSSSKGMDEDLLKTIEQSFQKFHSFLDLLRDAGLGQLCSLVGLSSSELQNPAVTSILKNHQPATSLSNGSKNWQEVLTGFKTTNHSENVQLRYPATNINSELLVSNGVSSRTRPNEQISVFSPPTVTSCSSHIGLRMSSNHDLHSTVYPMTTAVPITIENGLIESIPHSGSDDASGKVSLSVQESDIRNNANPHKIEHKETSPNNTEIRERNNRQDGNDDGEQRKERTLQDDSKIELIAVSTKDDGEEKNEAVRNKNNSLSAYKEHKQISDLDHSSVSGNMVVQDPTLITPAALKSGKTQRGDAASFHALNPEDATLPEELKDGGVVQKTSDEPHLGYSDDYYESCQSDHSRISTSTPEKTLFEPFREETFGKYDHELPSQVDTEEENSNNYSWNQHK